MDPKHGLWTASQARRDEISPPFDGYSLLDHQSHEHIENKLRINNITIILDTYRSNWCDQKQNIYLTSYL